MKEMKIRGLEKILAEQHQMLPEKEHVELLRGVRRKLKRMPDQLPGRPLAEKLSHFAANPLLNQLEIYKHKLNHGTLSREKRESLKRNERKYNELSSAQPLKQVMAADLEHPSLKAVRFNPLRSTKQELQYIFYQIGACYQDKRRLPEIIDAFFNDSLIGGSIIVTIEKAKSKSPRRAQLGRKNKSDDTIQAVGRYFVGLDKNDAPVLTADLFTSASYRDRTIKQWAESGRGSLAAFAPAVHMYLADRLGIDRMAFSTSISDEFAGSAAVPFKNVFEYRSQTAEPDKRKTGVIAVPDNSRGVWQSSIYKRHRMRVLESSELALDGLLSELKDVSSSITGECTSEGELKEGYDKKFSITPKFEVMNALLRIMQHSFLKNRKFEEGKRLYNSTVDFMKSQDADFARSYFN